MSKKEVSILCVLAALILGAVIAAVCIRAGREPERIVEEFTPPNFAQNAVDGAPASGDVSGLPYGTLSLTAEISVSMVSEFHVNGEGEAEVWFTAPATNRCWVMLRLLDADGNVIGETGLLKPGQYVHTLKLNAVPKKDGPVVARILTYEPDTYYSLGSANANVMLRVH